MQRQAVFFRSRSLHLDLHARDVDAGRTFAPTGFAGDAQFERIGHAIGGERIRPKLARDRKPQRVGAAARDVTLIARRTVAGTHDATSQGAACAVVVAHLDGALETASATRIGRPIQPRLKWLAVIARSEAQEPVLIKLRRP